MLGVQFGNALCRLFELSRHALGGHFPSLPSRLCGLPNLAERLYNAVDSLFDTIKAVAKLANIDARTAEVFSQPLNKAPYLVKPLAGDFIYNPDGFVTHGQTPSGLAATYPVYPTPT